MPADSRCARFPNEAVSGHGCSARVALKACLEVIMAAIFGTQVVGGMKWHCKHISNTEFLHEEQQCLFKGKRCTTDSCFSSAPCCVNMWADSFGDDVRLQILEHLWPKEWRGAQLRSVASLVPLTAIFCL